MVLRPSGGSSVLLVPAVMCLNVADVSPDHRDQHCVRLTDRCAGGSGLDAAVHVCCL